jgi:hypothetical protein
MSQTPSDPPITFANTYRVSDPITLAMSIQRAHMSMQLGDRVEVDLRGLWVPGTITASQTYSVRRDQVFCSEWLAHYFLLFL